MKTKSAYSFFLLLSLFVLTTQAFAQTSTQNYVRSRTMTNSAGNEYIEKITYYDGLGRQKQVVDRKMGGSGQDLVTLIEYDNYGRQDKAWLPAVRAGNNGAFVSVTTLRSAAISSNLSDSKPYSKTVYDYSPLNRVTAEYGPGNEWHTGARALHTYYRSNNTTNADLTCRMYKFTGTGTTISVTASGNYPAKELYVIENKDEDNNYSYTFTDKQGRTLLIRQKSGSDRFDTYYIYDDYGNLRVVLPPIAADAFTSSSQTDATANLAQYAYLYKYDVRNRCIAKKLPGAEWIYYIYDKSDRLIFSQDGEQRLSGEWHYSIPDALGRVVLEGICKNTFSYSANPLSGTVVTATWANTTNAYKGYLLNYTLTNSTVFSAYYYDSYDFRGKNSFPSGSDVNQFKEETLSGYPMVSPYIKGLLTGELHTMLQGTATNLFKVYYYDARGRMIQSKEKDHNGKIQKEFVSYAFDGLPEKKYLYHVAANNTITTEEYTYAYDSARRPTTTSHKLNNASSATIISSKTYNALGQLHKEEKGGVLNFETTHAYDVRSRLTYAGSNIYNENLTYTYGSNIASHQSQSHYGIRRKYTFSYDGLSRLSAAVYSVGDNNFSTSYTYDKHGNMQNIVRWGRKAYANYGKIDELTITPDGNRIKKVTDAIPGITDAASQDFKDYVNQTTEYTYNANGAMTQDLNRGISSVTYNLLNLPGVIDVKSPVAEARNEYYYSSDGVKRKVIKKWNPNYSTSPVIGSAVNVSSLTSTETTDYIGNLIYEGGTLKRIQTENGYIENGVYHYYLTDYQGNIRMVATSSDQTVQWLNYYPFGMLWADKVDNNLQPYKYSGKELDSSHGLNLYDFHARFYDPALGRFMTMDPLAEKYYSISPYAYCANNPMRWVDPTGMDIWEIDEEGNTTKRTKDKLRDAFYMVAKNADGKYERTYTTDSDGNKNYNSISFEYGTVTSVKTPTINVKKDGTTTPTELTTFEIKGDENATQLFEFMANPGTTTNVEWTHAKIGTESLERNIVGTSHSQSSTAVGHYLNKTGYTLREVNHNHPSGIGRPSKGDMKGAELYNKNTKLNIYTHPGQYSRYNKKGLTP